VSERPNFFQLLDLEPSQDDWATIEKRIREKQLQWARDTSGSKKVRFEAKRNLGLIAEMRRVLADAGLRRAEAEAARAGERTARAAEERKLGDWIAVLRGTGTCDETQLQKLVEQFDGVFTADEIMARLDAAGIRRVASVPQRRSQGERREGLDKVIAEIVRRNLELLGLASLYEFLGLASDASPAALGQRADEILRENYRLGRTDTRTAASSELAGACKTVFGDAEGKERYEVFRVTEVLDQIREQIELAAADRVIGREAMAALVSAAVQRGLAAEAAREAIESYAEGKGWAVQREVAEMPPPQQPPPAAQRPGAEPSDGAWQAGWPAGAPSAAAGPARQAPAPPRGGRPVPPVDRAGRSPGRGLVPLLLRGSLAAAAAGGAILLGSWLVGMVGSSFSAPPAAVQAAGSSPGAPGPAPLASSGAGATGVAAAGTVQGSPPAAAPGGSASAPAGGASSSGAGAGGPAAPASGGAAAVGSAGSRTARSAGSAAAAAAGVAAAATVPGASRSRPSGTATPAGDSSASGGFPPAATSSGGSGLSARSSGTASGAAAAAGRRVLGSSAVPGTAAPPDTASGASPELPESPVVAVLAEGDPLIASAVEDRLRSALRASGVRVRAGAIQRRAGDAIDLDANLDALAGTGVDVLVVAQVDPLGERELSYYGRKDIVRLAHLHVAAVRTADRRALGGGFSERLEYTTVNATSRAEGAIQGMMAGLVLSLQGRGAARR
jgi:hypothetical protein